MKYLLLGLFLLFFSISNSQKIEKNIFDKFDSTLSIESKDETLFGRLGGRDYLYVRSFYKENRKLKNIVSPIIKEYLILFGFKTNNVIAINEKSDIKIEFTDGTIGIYNSQYSYKIYTDFGIYSFYVKSDDKLFNTDIKSIRISTTDLNFDYDIPKKKTQTIKNLLTLIKLESEKVSISNIKDKEKNSSNLNEPYKKNENNNSNICSDCSKYIDTIIDKVTGDTMIASKKTILITNDIDKKGFSISLIKERDNGLIFSINILGTSSCIEENSKVNILFTDGSRLELYNKEKFNCKGEVNLYFARLFGNLQQLNELKSKKIKTLRIWTTDKFIQKDFTDENSICILNTIDCLTK